MSRLMLGIVCGVVFGALAAGSMLPMQFPDKRAALLGAFFSRFAVGLLIGMASTRWPGWVTGLVVGLAVSLPEAIITKAYAPILVIGCVGGAIVGWIVQRFGH